MHQVFLTNGLTPRLGNGVGSKSVRGGVVGPPNELSILDLYVQRAYSPGRREIQ